jgi:3,4-dihydroxy-2-butanone 4-phosphate synthase
MAQPGGVLIRPGHTEAGCDLARLAGLEPASVIVEILNEDGMQRFGVFLQYIGKHILHMHAHTNGGVFVDITFD